MTPEKPKGKPSDLARSAWPLIKELARPRWKILLLGLLLMIVNKTCSLVLPISTRYLIDNVIRAHQAALLTPLVLAVLGATLIQGVTSFTLTQLLSKEGSG